ncbi:MAG TPA: PPC domain-containing protein, partial [Verrucomicrobiae bacterium]|nr:PPC domain-containing protein [Verrucomicrobiae bacterium]
MEPRLPWIELVAFAAGLMMAPAVQAQARPYIGFVYPAGARRGTTSEIRLGGQGLDDVNAVLVTGSGVSARIAEYRRRLNNQEIQLLNEQLKELKRATSSGSSAPETGAVDPTKEDSVRRLVARIENRVGEFVQTPACAALASLAIVEVVIEPQAEPGRREIRLVTPRGVSNPLAFYVGQVPEFSRKPMLSATLQVLGKEARALRQRPAAEVEARVTIPCAVNGQIASGEVNRYRFEARQGQRLVISTLGRQLVPYIADAVPGWFQPVLTVHDAHGRELGFADDYRFKPDPVMLFEVPKDGEYVFAITDALYRGREDFVYRITIGELPFVTDIFPLGTKLGTHPSPEIKGWNLQGATLPPLKSAGPGVCSVVASRNEITANPVPFVLDELPDGFDHEPNDGPANAQRVALPVIVNGRIDGKDDWDVFQFTGKSNDTFVAEVQARRLDSPLDSILKLTDANGRLLAANDDREDLAAGLNTHHADSSFVATLPEDGTYYVHLGDTARQGGNEYAYRLRLSAPRPDFELRVVPSSIRIRTNSSAPVTVYVQRKDGFTGSIELKLKDPPPGFSAASVKLAAGQNNATLTIKGPSSPTMMPVDLVVVGRAKVGDRELAHEAVPADDRMQAFLWRHLVPADDLKALAWDPAYEPPSKRVVPVCLPSAVATNTPPGTNTAIAAPAVKPKFSKQQIEGRLRELKRLYEEGLIIDDFYLTKVA